MGVVFAAVALSQVGEGVLFVLVVPLCALNAVDFATGLADLVSRRRGREPPFHVALRLVRSTLPVVVWVGLVELVAALHKTALPAREIGVWFLVSYWGTWVILEVGDALGRAFERSRAGQSSVPIDSSSCSTISAPGVERT